MSYHTFATVEAKSQDGSVSSNDFTINVIDDPSDNPPTPIQVRIGRELTQDDITDNSTQF